MPAVGRIQANPYNDAFEQIPLGQEPGNERRDERTQVDAHVEDRKSGITSHVFLAV